MTPSSDPLTPEQADHLELLTLDFAISLFERAATNYPERRHLSFYCAKALRAVKKHRAGGDGAPLDEPPKP